MQAQTLVAEDGLGLAKDGIGEERMEAGDALGGIGAWLNEGDGDSLVGVRGPWSGGASISEHFSPCSLSNFLSAQVYSHSEFSSSAIALLEN